MLDTPTTPNRSDPRPPGVAAAHSVQGIYKFLKVNRHTIGLPIVLMALLMSIYIITAKPMYTAVTHLLIDANLPHILPEQPGDYRAAQLDAAQVDSQIAILRSDQIAMIVINKLQLLTDPDFLERASFFGVVPTSDSSKTQTRRVMDVFQSELQIRRQGRSYVLEVSYRSDKPEKA